jgi:putative tryptophan/tyrosine transport system substrate-binding protein
VLQLLTAAHVEAVPSVTRVAILLNPGNASTQFVLSETEATAKAAGIEFRAFEARQPTDFARVFAAMADQQVGALVIHEDTMLNANANALAIFAAVRRLPSSGFPEFVRAGGLLTYGSPTPTTAPLPSWTRYSRGRRPPIYRSSVRPSST